MRNAQNFLKNFLRQHLSYSFVKVVDVLDIPETYTLVGRLTIGSLPKGVYEAKVTSTWNLDVVNRSVYFRWRTNGEEWTEHVKEPKDSTDDTPFTYFYPVNWEGGSIDIEVEMRKEDISGTLNLHFLDIVVERKGDIL